MGDPYLIMIMDKMRTTAIGTGAIGKSIGGSSPGENDILRKRRSVFAYTVKIIRCVTSEPCLINIQLWEYMMQHFFVMRPDTDKTIGNTAQMRP